MLRMFCQEKTSRTHGVRTHDSTHIYEYLQICIRQPQYLGIFANIHEYLACILWVLTPWVMHLFFLEQDTDWVFGALRKILFWVRRWAGSRVLGP